MASPKCPRFSPQNLRIRYLTWQKGICRWIKLRILRWKHYSEISRLIQCGRKDFWEGRQKDETREGDVTMETGQGNAELGGRACR